MQFYKQQDLTILKARIIYLYLVLYLYIINMLFIRYFRIKCM